jgi:hypothetical protein
VVRVSALDLGQDLPDIPGGEGVARGCADDLEFLGEIASRLAAIGGAQGLPDPLRHRHLLSASDPLNFAKLRFLE